MTVVSVDLAHRKYRDFGMVVLDDGPSGTRYELVPFAHDTPEAPTPELPLSGAYLRDREREAGAKLSEIF
jgi:hypothetical protein